jgi:hypothetical protein
LRLREKKFYSTTLISIPYTTAIDRVSVRLTFPHILRSTRIFVYIFLLFYSQALRFSISHRARHFARCTHEYLSRCLLRASAADASLCNFICMYLYIYKMYIYNVFIYIYTHTYIYIYIYMCVYMYVILLLSSIFEVTKYSMLPL